MTLNLDGSSKYTVCLYHDGLAEPLAMFRECFWPSQHTPKMPRAEFESSQISQGRDPQGPTSPVVLFLKGGEVLGHIASIPVQVFCRSRISPAHWVVGFMVLPEHRKGPIGVYLIRKVNESFGLVMTLTVEQAPLRIFKGLGWRDLGILPQYIMFLKSFKLLSNIRLNNIEVPRGRGFMNSRLLETTLNHVGTRRILAMVCTSIFALLSWRRILKNNEDQSFKVLEENDFNESYDILWAQVAEKFPALVARDRAYLVKRYSSQPARYRILACRKGGKLRSFCILTVKMFANDPRMGNAKIATIIDCLFDPQDSIAFSSLIANAVRFCEREGADAIFCTVSHAQVQDTLRKCGFVGIPGNLNFVYHDRLKVIDESIGLESWHLMRGDCDADGNF